MSNQIHIGKIVATFGVKGELILVHALGKKIFFKKGDIVFVEFTKAQPLPYFIESSKAKNTTETFILFEGVNSKEVAHPFISKKAWLAEDDFKKLAGKQAAIGLLGLLLIDDGKPLSVVEEVIEQPHQVLVRITLEGKEVLIPLHEETLQKIDRKKNELHVILPEGLLDVYLL